MANYNSNFESMFPEAESVMTSKVSPTLYVNNTVFAPMEDMEKQDLEQDKLYWTKTKIVWNLFLLMLEKWHYLSNPKVQGRYGKIRIGSWHHNIMKHDCHYHIETFQNHT